MMDERVCVDEASDILRQWREEETKKSLKTLKLGKFLIEQNYSGPRSEVCSLYEQTCMAALDCGDNSLAEKCLKYLEKSFSQDSLRVSRLQGLCLEAQKRYDEAEKLYREQLSVHPTCTSLWKRKIAIMKGQGKIIDAIKELNEFLLVFMTDSEAWLELSDLYIGINDLLRAAYCVEELILTNPHNHLYHLKYAEICYSFGSAERMELARKHYATAVKLNPCCLRALYGFYMVCQWIGKGKQSDSKSKNSQYVEWAKLQIKRCYQFDDIKLRIIEKMLG